MTDDPTSPAIAALPAASIADLLAASASIVVAELTALGAEAGWRPEPGEWSANECVGHLIEAERRGFAGRIRTIVAGGPGGSIPAIPPDLEDWDPPAVAARRRDHLRDAEFRRNRLGRYPQHVV